MSWVFLSVESVRALHYDLIKTYGGSDGLRDPGLLESAVLRAENRANFDPDATTASLAASLSFGLIKNHAFIDGNKRIGLAALVAFLALNGWRLTPVQVDQIEMVKAVAASEMTEAEWTAWVERSVGPL